jgi:transposase-like protein
MTCHNCCAECQRFGKHRNGLRRFRCRQCRKTFTEPHENALDGMYLPIQKAELVLRLLLEGSSVSTVERITEVHHATILELLVLAGEKSERVMAQKIRNVQVRDVECGEVWSFIGKKEKRVRLQLLPPSPDLADDACDGRWRDGSHVERARTAGGRVRLLWFPMLSRPPP